MRNNITNHRSHYIPPIQWRPRGRAQIKNKKGFSLTEILITFSLFILLSGVGIGAYLQYYKVSLIHSDVDKALTLMQNTRFKALKNPSNDNYGIHIDVGMNRLIGFRSAYNPANAGNDVIQLEKLRVTELNLNPDISITNEILFENKTAKTDNFGSFTISDNNLSYTYNINLQGIIELR